jgi:hypothetical protein
MRLKAVLAAYLVAGVVPAHSAGGLTDIARNEHNYTLKLDLLTFVNGNWQGDANFTISACPRPECFHLSGSLLFPNGGDKASFPIPRLACDLHFEEVPHKGMDSGDYRVTMVSRAQTRNGCASVPGDLTGVYKEIPSLSGKSQP